VKRTARLLGVMALMCAAVPTWADTALQSGIASAITLPSVNATAYFHIDIDASAQQLKINVAANGGDVDLFVRYGSPFPTASASVSISEDLLNRYAHYHALSANSAETITVLPSGHVPLRAGRWYIVAINSAAQSAGGNLTATTTNSLPTGSIAVDFGHPGSDCDTSYWTDATAATPVGGNPGTTLGEQRKNALTYATQQLVQQLQSPATITVHACAAHLGGDAQSAILAHAGPLWYVFDEPGFPLPMLSKKYTWYPAAAITRQSGTSLCAALSQSCSGLDGEEIEATFNADIGTPDVIGGEAFYFGYTADPNSGSLDFITIAMHEITHGLGFFGLVNSDAASGPIGAKLGISTDPVTQQPSTAFENLTDGPWDDVFDDNIAIVDGNSYTPFMGYEVNGSRDAARAAAMVSGPTVTSAGTYDPGIYTGLRWFDPAATDATVNVHHLEPAPNDFPSLYAPCDKSATTTCATQKASTLSHTVQTGDMMNA